MTQWVLATDLDGTFVGGSPEARRALYETLEAQRDKLTLVFVTGRDLPHVQSLCDNGEVPTPDLVIGDVGTSVVHWPTQEPVEPLQSRIAERWEGANERVKSMLAETPHIKPQAPERPYRVSYYYEPEHFDLGVLDHVRQAGFDAILSASVYFDVLPRGVHKGSTLRALAEHLGFAEDRIIVAGDTMNDLALFETGYAAVCVSNAEDALKSKVSGLAHTFMASREGAEGVHEGMRHFGAL